MDIENLQSDIDALMKEKNPNEEFKEAHDLYEFLDYDGSLHGVIDSNIDIYNYNLRVWAVDNWKYCSDALEEGLSDGKDYHGMIQSGQYLYLQEKAFHYIEKLYEKMAANS